MCKLLYTLIVLSLLNNKSQVSCDKLCGGLVTLKANGCGTDLMITIPSDGTGVNELVLDMSMPIYTDKDIDVDLENKEAVQWRNAPNLIYVVSTPRCDLYPRITRLVFNNRLLCRNEPYEANTIHPATQFSHSSTYYSVVSQTNKITPPVTTPQPITINSICGYSTFALIQGGSEVQNGEFPWLGGLFTIQNKHMYRCTVNLISDNLVLTAAHCFGITNETSAYGILWGPPKIGRGQKYYAGLRSFTLHPNFNHLASHDIALATLAQSVTFTRTLKPICLGLEPALGDATPTSSGSRGLVAGFGPDYTELRKIEYPIVSRTECLASDIIYHEITTNFTFCAGTRRNGEGPCVGDSGAGFMLVYGNRYYLRGLVSETVHANGGCNLQEFVVFADLWAELDWLRSVLK